MSRWATFDCYGTLVDWNAGLRASLGSDELLARYHDLEPQVQAEDPSLSYREVLRETSRRLGVDADPAASLPEWPVFPEVPGALSELRERGWRLAILSNSDRDLIEASIGAIGIDFDLAVVASEIGSYKPAHRHWRAFEEQTGRLPDVHVAQSLFHDIAAAGALGIPTVWINRLGERAEPDPTRQLTDLRGLAGVVEQL
jgi:2-haloacid dehalogenase